MAITVIAALGAVLAMTIYTTISGLLKGIAMAKKTGFVYVVSRESLDKNQNGNTLPTNMVD
jgi:hypothetical protein